MDKEKILDKLDSVVNSSNAKTVSMIILVSIIIIGYLFFFFSPKIVGESYDFSPSEVGSIITLENGHTVKLTRCDVDFSNKILEYEFYFQNTNYDGCNDYDVNIKSASRNGKILSLKTDTICSDNDVYVVRALLPKSWTAVVADITVKNKENEQLEAKFYETSETLYSTTIKHENSREYFLRLDTSRSIEILNNNINEIKQENIALQNKIREIDNNILKLNNRLAYMTEDELTAAQSDIEQITAERETAIKQIDDNKKTISNYQENIIMLQEKLNQN